MFLFKILVCVTCITDVSFILHSLQKFKYFKDLNTIHQEVQLHRLFIDLDGQWMFYNFIIWGSVFSTFSFKKTTFSMSLAVLKNSMISGQRSRMFVISETESFSSNPRMASTCKGYIFQCYSCDPNAKKRNLIEYYENRAAVL